MGQWQKINNGNLQVPKEKPTPAPGPEVEAAKRLRKVAEVGNGVTIHPDIVNGQPGIRIKIGFE